MIPSAATFRKYGITLEQYLDLVELIGPRCPLCNKRFTLSRPRCIDHDHLTGCVRGLLCRPCNHKLGLMHENVGWLEAAARYLRHWPTESLRHRWGGDLPRVPDAPPIKEKA